MDGNGIFGGVDACVFCKAVGKGRFVFRGVGVDDHGVQGVLLAACNVPDQRRNDKNGEDPAQNIPFIIEPEIFQPLLQRSFFNLFSFLFKFVHHCHAVILRNAKWVLNVIINCSPCLVNERNESIFLKKDKPLLSWGSCNIIFP